MVYYHSQAEVVELADALDSKSNVGNYVWVQVPPSAPIKSLDAYASRLFLLLELMVRKFGINPNAKKCIAFLKFLIMQYNKLEKGAEIWDATFIV